MHRPSGERHVTPRSSGPHHFSCLFRRNASGSIILLRPPLGPIPLGAFSHLQARATPNITTATLGPTFAESLIRLIKMPIHRFFSKKGQTKGERLAESQAKNEELRAQLEASRAREWVREAQEAAEAQRREQARVYELEQQDIARIQLEASRRREQQLRQEQDALRQEQEAKLREARRREEALRQEQEKKAQLERDRRDYEDRLRQEKQRKAKQASPDALRELRELMLERYRLDVYIWSMKGARKPDQPLVKVEMEKADDILGEIMYKVEAWTDNSDGHWTEREWEKVQEIQNRLRKRGKREWVRNPPWADRR
ncbi:hypothetical protein EJ04DRAFT_516133 [Polyplosphaeria fusca]|uniref:Uncharacterized protein n=1 Tax=Polyplosphaeria fusca TaxID=682080 RepID=A0A9P4QPJ1_9PLEO|nr:hypothetical protein EJ04DRAFT_516133 [Polyplosphaeria fusca]